MRRTFASIVSLVSLVACVLPLGLSQPLPAQAAAVVHAPVQADPPPGGTPEITTASDRARQLLGNQLGAVASSGGSQLVTVQVFIEPGTDLGRVAERWRATTVPVAGRLLAVARVRADRLVKLASVPGVIAVLPQAEHPSPNGHRERTRPRTPEGPRMNPKLWYARESLGVNRAGVNGYDGSGVIVGIEESGIDFGHPDLHGTFARDPRPSSPYYGYPLMYDDESAASYVLSGGDPDGTYYADSSRSFTANVAINQVGTITIRVPAFRGNVFFGDDIVPTTINKNIRYRNTSRSGTIHYGAHPESYLWRIETIDGQDYTVPAIFLVSDETVANRYNSVYTDLGALDGDLALVATYDFSTVRPARLGLGLDPTVVKDLDGDGLSDLSGGLVYFIADGTHHIPVLDWLWDANGRRDPANRITPPARGALVAFFGDFNGDSHGTGVASQIVGQGIINSRYGQFTNTPPLAAVTDGDRIVAGATPGLAPGARVFGTRHYGLPNQWLAMTLGYDGLPNSGDDAQVINNSWSFTEAPTSLEQNDTIGTALNTLRPQAGSGLPNQVIAPRTLFVVAAGNSGNGYTTTGDGPESGSSILSVAASTQYGSDDITGIISDVVQITNGDPASFSSRGPNLYGRPGNAVTAVGSSASGAVPLVQVFDFFTYGYNGNMAWGEFGGTSQAAPQASAVAALMFQAYKARTGQFPTWDVARNLMQNGARDAHQDPATQGAGIVDADYTTAVAGGLYGVSITPSDQTLDWQVGNFRGTRYLQFPNIATRGQSYTRTYTITNNSPRTVTVNLASDQLTQIGTRNFTINTDVGNESGADYRRPDYLIKPGQLAIPANTDLMRVQLAQEFGRFCGDDPAGPHTSCTSLGNNAWYLRAYAWTDWNKNGQVWADFDGNGAVNDGELDLPATPDFADQPNPALSLELNALAEGALSGNSQDVRIQRPLERGADGVLLGLVHYTRNRNASVPTDTLRLKVSYYRHQPWPLLTLSRSSLTLAPGASSTVQATARIPNDAAYGYHQGSIRVTTTSGPASAALRVLHAAAGLDDVDVYIDGTRVLADLPFNNPLPASYRDLAAGVHRVQIKAAGSNAASPSLIDQRIELAAGTEYTLATVIKSDESAAIQVLADGNSAPASGQAKLRIVNLSPDAGPVDFYVDSTRLLTGVSYREISRYLSVIASAHELRVTEVGTPGPILLELPPRNVQGTSTLYLVGRKDGLPVLAAQLATAPPRSHFPSHVTALPVVANVAASSNLGNAQVFGNTSATANTLFDIGSVNGLYDWRGNGMAVQGDWRNFFVDVPAAQTPGSKFLLNTTWTHAPTDIDLSAYGPQPRSDVGYGLFAANTSIFGPYDMTLKARSQDTLHDADGFGFTAGEAFSFQTATGTTSEWLSGPLAQGLHSFSMQNVLYSGKNPAGDAFRTVLGRAQVMPDALNIYSRRASGTTQISFTSSLPLPGLQVAAYGVRADQIYNDTVGQSNPPGDPSDPNGNKTYDFTVTNSGLLDIRLTPITNTPGYDLDMVLYRKNGNNYDIVASSAGATAEEAITIRLPEPGAYRVLVNGYVSPPNSRYELHIRNLDGTQLQITGVPSGTIGANQTVLMTVRYQAGFTDVRRGVIYIGPRGAPSVFDIPVTINGPTFLPLLRR